MSTEAFESVKIARDSKRPTGLDYINAMFSEFFELHGDRRFGDDAAIVGGVAYLGRQPVTVIAIEKATRSKSATRACLVRRIRKATAKRSD